jgi:hypothetical protein
LDSCFADWATHQPGWIFRVCMRVSVITKHPGNSSSTARAGLCCGDANSKDCVPSNPYEI